LLVARELIFQEAKEIECLSELLDPDVDDRGLTIIDRAELTRNDPS